MKLINYSYGYFPEFECSIHGKIIMTKQEWERAYLFLMRGAKRWLPSYPWTISILKEDKERKVKSWFHKNAYIINIRVPATETIVKRYGLNNYKRGNVMIEVI